MDSRIDAKGTGASLSAQLGADQSARKSERRNGQPKAQPQVIPAQVRRDLVEVNKEAARAFLQIGEMEMPKIRTFERPEIDRILQDIKQNPDQALASQANMRRENVLKIIMPE
jgi:hypothetical protein